MARLSITAAWDQTTDILRRDFGALFTIALALNALPQFLYEAIGRGGPGQVAGAQLLLSLLVLLVILALGAVGSIAISALALGIERVVGTAIARGFRSFLPLLALTAVVIVVAGIVLAFLLVASGVSPARMAVDPSSALRRFAIDAVILLAVALPLGARMLMVTPVAAAERAGPIRLVARSWALTRGHFWKLLGFVVLVVIVLLVAALALGAVVSLLANLVAGRPAPGNLSQLIILIISGLARAAAVAVFTTLLARIYAQLAGTDPVSTAKVFE